jgi:hypothetical protein
MVFCEILEIYKMQMYFKDLVDRTRSWGSEEKLGYGSKVQKQRKGRNNSLKANHGWGNSDMQQRACSKFEIYRTAIYSASMNL